MNSETPNHDSLSYDELLEQNRALRAELDEFRMQEAAIWNLFVETSRKFQVYSASIKAAVSSLLDHNILWDNANQHEFLQTINSSVDQVSEVTALLTLAFRAQANSLVLSTDFHLLQEILSSAQDTALKKMPGISLEISFPREGKPVLVDYEYLNKALVLLFEVLFTQSPAGPVRVVASEMDGAWRLDWSGANPAILRVIEEMHHGKTQPGSNEILSAENMLRLHVTCEIFHLQQISVDVLEEPGQSATLRLRVPDVVNP